MKVAGLVARGSVGSAAVVELAAVAPLAAVEPPVVAVAPADAAAVVFAAAVAAGQLVVPVAAAAFVMAEVGLVDFVQMPLVPLSPGVVFEVVVGLEDLENGFEVSAEESVAAWWVLVNHGGLAWTAGPA